MEVALMELEKCLRTSGDGMEEEQEKAENSQDAATKNELNQQPVSLNNEKIAAAAEPPLVLPQRTNSRRTSQTNCNSTLPLPGLHTLYRRPECVTRSLKPVIPKGELVMLKPRLIDQLNSLPEHKKTKPPKFIPFEPYPGAVNAIVPKALSSSSTPRRQSLSKPNRNNLDIAVLVSQMSTMRTQELEDSQGASSDNSKLYEKTENNQSLKTNSLSEAESKEILRLKQELEKVREERDHFQAQFKFQTQVNSELKNLLVASVGEDLLTRVNVLTEDKLQLARALLDTAKNLTTHTEQIEFLAGQCEVWRSKFLASSVMVEELARWKADLTQKNQMLSESTKRLLHTTHQMRQHQLDMLKNLKFIAKIRYLNLPATDLVTLAAENLNILQQLVLHTNGVGMPEGDLSISSASSSTMCDSEKYAVQALEFISQPLIATDDAIKALFGQVQRPYTATTQMSSTHDGAVNTSEIN